MHRKGQRTTPLSQLQKLSQAVLTTPENDSNVDSTCTGFQRTKANIRAFHETATSSKTAV
jgi:hypothetical protein